MKRTLCLSGLALLAVLAFAPAARAEENTAKVSFLDGKATVTSGGKTSPLAKGGTVKEYDVVETDPAAKVELELKDGSVLRVGPASKLELKAAHFGAQGEKTFSAKLFFGRVWSKVSGAMV